MNEKINPALENLVVPLDTLKPDAKNARKHDERNIQAIVDSFQQFGQQKPLVALKDGTVIAGNGTLEALKRLGWEKAAVVVFDSEEKAKAAAFAISDNRTAELASWDKEVLGFIFKDLKVDFDVSKLGFDGPDMKVLDALTQPKPSGEDSLPEMRETEIKMGDLFQLGRHRLLCGDSTEPNQVKRLMDGRKAGLMNTDPPYGIEYKNDDRPYAGKAKPRIANDDIHDDMLQAFLEKAFSVAKYHALLPNAAWYIWHAYLTQAFFAEAAAAAAAADIVLHRQIIWVKNNLVLGRGQYHWKHEPCFMGWARGNMPPDYGRGNDERDQTTIWEIAGITQAERNEFNHSTPKPVELFRIPIIKHLQPGEVCYEPFAGTGPQLVAAEQERRTCYGLEIEPAYCQVIIDRWERLTGQKAVKLG